MDPTVTVRGADSNIIKLAGVGFAYMRDTECSHWKRVHLIITVQGSHTLISCSDLKNLHLLNGNFPEFIREGKARRGFREQRKESVGNQHSVVSDTANTLHTVHDTQGEGDTGQ